MTISRFTLSGIALPATGKILQIVRATDSTTRSTTSATFADVTGMSVTITPTKATSTIFIIAKFVGVSESSGSGSNRSEFRLTTSGGTALSGAEGDSFGTFNYTQSGGAIGVPFIMIGFDSPANTSANTYKLQFQRGDANSTCIARNSDETGQMLAIEVAA